MYADCATQATLLSLTPLFTHVHAYESLTPLFTHVHAYESLLPQDYHKTQNVLMHVHNYLFLDPVTQKKTWQKEVGIVKTENAHASVFIRSTIFIRIRAHPVLCLICGLSTPWKLLPPKQFGWCGSSQFLLSL